MMKGGDQMKQSYYTDENKLNLTMLNSVNYVVRNFSFDVVSTRDNCAHFQVNDCFECLSPHGDIL